MYTATADLRVISLSPPFYCLCVFCISLFVFQESSGAYPCSQNWCRLEYDTLPSLTIITRQSTHYINILYIVSSRILQRISWDCLLFYYHENPYSYRHVIYMVAICISLQIWKSPAARCCCCGHFGYLSLLSRW